MVNKVETKVAVEQVTLTEPQKLWNEIKGKQLDLFGLPNQTIEQYSNPVEIDGVRLFLSFTVQAFLPALEEALGPKFSVERSNKYLIVTKK